MSKVKGPVGAARGFSDFFRNAQSWEKKKVFAKALHEASSDQRRVVIAAEKKAHYSKA
jgi:hypothetical protein